eukprot:gene10228-8146_t
MVSTNASVACIRNLLKEKLYKQLMKKHPQKMYLIGFDRMAAAAPIPSADSMHFQCGVPSAARSPIDDKLIKEVLLVSDGHNAREGCKDGVKFGLVQMMLNFICLDDPISPEHSHTKPLGK